MIWLVAGLLGYAALVEPGLLFHRRFDLALRRLPAGWDGARVHFLTDLHCNRRTRMEERIRRAFAGPSDLILLGGDMVHRNESVAHIAYILETAEPRLGVYAVLGNAERKGWVDTERLISQFGEIGVRVLRNEHVLLERGGDRIALVGVDDPYKGHADPARALAGCPESFRLMLVHAPQILRHPEAGGADLILTGHTHGGQVRLPWVGPLMAHNLFEWRWSGGYYPPETVRRRTGLNPAPHVYVSRGVATGSIHFRFLCPPEVRTITLRATP